jgi:protein involved in polysaccharide export with SLBB domain
MTLVKAIQNAGYFTDYAKRSKVRITRQDGKTFTVNFDRANEDPRYDEPIYPGDSITVPKKSI